MHGVEGSIMVVLTKKMEMLIADIYGLMGNLPPEQRGYIFGYNDEVDMNWVHTVVGHLALEFIKYAYDYSAPEYSLRHFLNNPNDDSDRMLQWRIMQYVMEHKKYESEVKGRTPPKGHRFSDMGLDTIDKKLKGHRLTGMNFFEHQNIHNLGVIKAIVERRILSAKKISNNRFREIFEEYDLFVGTLIERSKTSDEEMVFSSLALFTFEWHFPIETLFSLACFMEEEGLDYIDQDTLILLCGSVRIDSMFGGMYFTDSRMVMLRQEIIPYMFSQSTDQFRREELKNLIMETLVLCVQCLETMVDEAGELYKDWFRKESCMEDWASFLRAYNIFEIWQKKEWTNKRIRNMRYLFEQILAPKL